MISIIPDEAPDLSQRLAEHGLMPMFGFPTPVRCLYPRPPMRSQPWPPEGAIDRDMRLAISEFAPGNEIVRDKLVYTPVGLAGFTPTGRQPQVTPALGPTRDVGLCDTCQAINDRPGAAHLPELRRRRPGLPQPPAVAPGRLPHVLVDVRPRSSAV